ncbi:OLC1v1012164C1 [Oldenlandia corymbosa var. corymbosa]|uniref:OLC1v1012164C1 n=1 Tax=Oldenlandia corymbosa var. corymbosa TaxID=529605 RepID=A0AAV1DXI7_OLDCO|nr:OLC1v1012164C1 [Oldenlandia corymbosa var. corymbosa]
MEGKVSSSRGKRTAAEAMEEILNDETRKKQCFAEPCEASLDSSEIADKIKRCETILSLFPPFGSDYVCSVEELEKIEDTVRLMFPSTSKENDVSKHKQNFKVFPVDEEEMLATIRAKEIHLAHQGMLNQLILFEKNLKLGEKLKQNTSEVAELKAEVARLEVEKCEVDILKATLEQNLVCKDQRISELEAEIVRFENGKGVIDASLRAPPAPRIRSIAAFFSSFRRS